MQPEFPDGWEVPVYHALASPQTLLLCGVPQAFFLGNVLLTAGVVVVGNLVAGVLWWKMGVLAVLLHAGVAVGTAVDMQWLDVWRRYRRYAPRYEG